MEYVHWLARVNSVLGRLSNRTLTAEDLDYEWSEAHLVGESPELAAKAALARAGQPTELKLRGLNHVREAALSYGVRPSVLIEHRPLVELSDTDLLALVIGGPVASSSAEEMLEALSYDLKQLYNASLEELTRNYAGVGQAAAKRIKAALELGKRLLQPQPRRHITCPRDVFNHLSYHGLPLCDQEELWVLCLDTQNRVQALTKVYRGNVNTSIIRPGEVLRSPVRLNARGMVISHNHPSGDPTPSPEDVQVTRNICQAAELFDIQLLDHIIVVPDKFVSLKERGLGFDV